MNKAKLLLGPGPSNANQRVLDAMSAPLIGHLDPEFLEVMAAIKEMLQRTFQTRNHLTFAVSAPGSAGMETCLVNLLDPGDEALICVHGVFGNRMSDIVERCGAKLIRVDAPWGEPVDPLQVKDALEKCNPKLVAIVHAETSTGVLQPLEEISKMVHEAGSLLVVDAVTSFCGTTLKIDDWGIDAVYSGSQKCLSAPPGLSPVSFSERAVEVVHNRKSKVQSWFLDLSLVSNYWQGAKRAYHHTAPVSSMFALKEALTLVVEEGLENRYARHWQAHELLKSGMESLGFELLVKQGFRLPMLNAIKLPDHIDDAAVRKQLLDDYGIEIGAGLGDFAGKVWRIGLMGENARPESVDRLLTAIKEIS
ncbi:MAG: serine--pyruvate aminotransferase [Cyclobacteriaceae bacterium]|nr:MAG: serine--pyruvate aminotransferase [Cyclobacteriaceae bacterium]